MDERMGRNPFRVPELKLPDSLPDKRPAIGENATPYVLEQQFFYGSAGNGL
jgi:hypothetical protein